MIRIEKFKQLLRERIADYESRYDATKDKLIFGALQEAKDTLEYIENQFPFLGARLPVQPSKIKISVSVEKLYPDEKPRIKKVATMRELEDGTVRTDEHSIEMEKYFVLESFYQFLIAERKRVIKWHNEEDFIGAEMLIVMPSYRTF